MLFTLNVDCDAGCDWLELMKSAWVHNVFISCAQIEGPAGGNPELKLASRDLEQLKAFLRKEFRPDWELHLTTLRVET